MRGHSTIQGSPTSPPCTTCCPVTCRSRPPTRSTRRSTPTSNTRDGHRLRANFRKFIVSLQKAWYGDAATPETDFGFSWLPRVDADYSQLAYFDRMAKGEVKGYFLFGQNPGGGGPNAGPPPACATSTGWSSLDSSRPSAVFWKSDLTGPPPADIKTEVFFLPAAAAGERRQPHQHAADAPVAPQGPRPARRQPVRRVVHLQPRQAASRRCTPARPIRRTRRLLNLTWDYSFDEPPRLPDGTVSRIEDEPDLRRFFKRSTPQPQGDRPFDGKAEVVSGFAELKDDGSTACGCWIYSGSIRNRPATGPKSASAPTTLSTRSGASPGRTTAGCCTTAPPRTPKAGHGRIAKTRLVGRGVAALGRARPARFRNREATRLPTAVERDWHGGHRRGPAVHHQARRPRLALRPRHQDGPRRRHYEPVESPVGNLLYPKQTCSPTVRTFEGPLNRLAHTPTTEFRWWRPPSG